MVDAPFTVLVPAVGGPVPPEALDVTCALAAATAGRGTVLGVVEVPHERSLSESALAARRQRSLLRKVSQMARGAELGVEVQSAYSLDDGIRAAVVETGANLLVLPWKQTRRRPALGALGRLVADPPCDMVTVKPGNSETIGSVLVTVRGGPHARLALRIAEAMAAGHHATLTLLHVVSPSWLPERRTLEHEFFDAVRAAIRYPDVAIIEVESSNIASTLLEEASRHDLVVMGAAARDTLSPYLFGQIPEAIAQHAASAVAIVKTREPVTALTFGLPQQPLGRAVDRAISQRVDRWFAESTFHSHEFRNIRHLVELKERQGLTVSVALPTLNEEKTVGKILTTIKRHLIDNAPLVDELLVVDSDSDDRTAEIAEGLGVPVVRHPAIMPELGTYGGKGEALWKSLFATHGDIVVWIDSDITGIHPKFVYGLLGPLLTNPRVGFVKGFYRRPLRLGGELLTTGGGRVTELTARPLINLFYPDLSGLVQPLAGEMAGRREVLESVAFFTGYGVETGLLIDICEQFGLRSIAQVDLENRVHRNQTLLALSKMAFAIVQVVIKRLGDRKRIQLLEDVNTSMKLIHYSPTELFLEVKEIQEYERPSVKSVRESMTMVAVDGMVGDTVRVP